MQKRVETARRVLGIDPGYDRCGVAVVERRGHKETLLYSNCIIPEKGELGTRFLELGTRIEALIAAWHPQTIACEKIFFTRNQKTGIAVAELRGIIRYLSAQHRLLFCEYTPQEIKRAVTGYGNAEKAQVESMVRALLRMEKARRYDDEYDAVAVGLTALPSLR